MNSWVECIYALLNSAYLWVVQIKGMLQELIAIRTLSYNFTINTLVSELSLAFASKITQLLLDALGYVEFILMHLNILHTACCNRKIT